MMDLLSLVSSGLAVYSALLPSPAPLNTLANLAGTVDSYVSQGDFNTDGGALKTTKNTALAQTAFTSNRGRNGGAVYNDSGITLHISDSVFRSNLASLSDGYGGAIYNAGILSLADTKFEKNGFEDTARVLYGGALANYGTLSVAGSSFVSNQAWFGGAIHNAPGSSAEIINSVFQGNSAMESGAVYNEGKLTLNGAVFENNSSETYGGALSNYDTAIVRDSRFTGNKSQAEGGAIYNKGELTVVADQQDTVFSGNLSAGVANAVYMAKENAVLRLETSADHRIIFDDGIDGLNGYKIDIVGKGSGLSVAGGVAFNNSVRHAGNIRVKNANLALSSAGSLEGADLELDHALLNLKNDSLQTLRLNSFKAGNHSSLAFDVDLSSGLSDQIIAQTASGTLSLEAVNILQDGTKDFQPFSDFGDLLFDNLDSFRAYTDSYTYRFAMAGGALSVKARYASDGLNAAVSDSAAANRSFSLQKNTALSADLGALKGANAKLTVFGNGYELSGADGSNKSAGITVSAGQTLSLNNLSAVRDFQSHNGGFIANAGGLNIINTSFINNHASGQGGAIYSSADVNLISDNGSRMEFTGNTAGSASNAIYMADASAALNIQTAAGSSITFNDSIDGAQGYRMNFDGDGQVTFNAAVANAGLIDLRGGEVRLTGDEYFNHASIKLTGGHLRLDNGQMDRAAEFKSLTGGEGILHLDVNTFAGTSDYLRLQNLYGTVKVIAHNPALSDTAGSEEEIINFAEVSDVNNGRFEILRVNGSAYKWDSEAVSERARASSVLWSMKKSAPLADGRAQVTAETVAYLGLPAAALEQTRSLFHNLENRLASSQIYYRCCGYYDQAYDHAPQSDFWFNPVYNGAEINAPVDINAEISGFESGLDLYADSASRAGLFASYRHGKYDLNGDSKWLYSAVSSEAKINSYLGGLYYHFAQNNLWLTAAAYGGLQQADIKTDDGITADTEAVQFGADFAAGRAFRLRPSLILEPSLRLGYNRIDFDTLKDDYGKTAAFDKVSEITAEASLKLEKYLPLDSGFAKVYLQPSVLQIIADEGRVDISSLPGFDTLADRTLGRIAVGFSGNLSDNLSLFGKLSHTFGEDYSAQAVDLGIGWRF